MSQAATIEEQERGVSLETDPTRWRHIRLEMDGPVARIRLDIREDGGLRPEDYKLKLNSYDLGVDVELADAVQRLRFEHPEVGCVVVTSARKGVFSAGANIFMLRTSSHAFKVNFCKYTNETRLAVEDATENSGQVYLAALNGLASGGGYELPLACREIHLVDDRKSAVSLPEVPYLGVLPGTGGLTRVVDKRKVRRDLADVFSTLAEGVKGKRAVEWGLVDAVWPPSKFHDRVEGRAREIAGEGHPERRGIELDPLTPSVTQDGLAYRHVRLTFGPIPRTATIEIRVPGDLPDLPAAPRDLGAAWFPLRAFRELDDVLLRLRFHHPQTGVILLKTRGPLESVLKLDEQLLGRRDDWFVREVTLLMKRVLKRLDLTARSFFALLDEGSCFAGSLLETALAADRAYMLEGGGVALRPTPMNDGPLPMSNGLSRLGTRFLGNPGALEGARAAARHGRSFTGAQAEEAGLVTFALDDIDWDDEIRLALEERASLSPDSLTAMEASLRFPGPETLETKIFGRLSAWQNWVFQRPNAVGPTGALSLYGQPQSPQFDWRRT